jgi:hypothetical protein
MTAGISRIQKIFDRRILSSSTPNRERRPRGENCLFGQSALEAISMEPVCEEYGIVRLDFIENTSVISYISIQ